ncbi:hypothetical protein INT46_004311 [Mucor plumbeus]|uniref:Uncharacterized protein n=1 Tax=Mucor plumbeus TaxID=97098 RepID=A0A8H7UQS4_9FUNG|nr:hypothetical protein INT46_004311 [Mucor plumbeus]
MTTEMATIILSLYLMNNENNSWDIDNRRSNANVDNSTSSSEEETDSTSDDNRYHEQDDNNLSRQFHRYKHEATFI